MGNASADRSSSKYGQVNNQAASRKSANASDYDGPFPGCDQSRLRQLLASNGGNNRTTSCADHATPLQVGRAGCGVFLGLSYAAIPRL